MVYVDSQFVQMQTGVSPMTKLLRFPRSSRSGHDPELADTESPHLARRLSARPHDRAEFNLTYFDSRS